ncbi:uncharacterized protein LOC117333660 [Pecten maximus]|uniref:uncharacterized protein LOC117333660 n=1 Tax=Pecten maximus TaxID=6579 RepID=UPI0014590051|nr:uncharacterized protein LOC117333660 [Pecten maximus]
MGVDLAVYRARVGQFVPRTVKNALSNTGYLCKAIASVRGDLTHDKLDIKGAVTFIDLLLRIQGIEPNPGPGKPDQQLFTEEQAEDNNDINNTFDSNTNPVSADRISQFMESLVPVSSPNQPGSSTTSENAGAVAITGVSAGVAIPTTINQLTVNYVDKRKYREEIKVETMNMEHAENVCTGEQTIVHTEASGGNEDDHQPETKEKNPKRILLEENAETMLTRHIEEMTNILVTRTKAENEVVKRLKDYNMVIISGVTGEGKTTLGREICRKLRDGTLDNDIKQKTPVLITVPQDWSDVVNDKDDIVVFVDDIFGKTNYQTGLLNGWKPFFDRTLQSLREGKVCLVVTSRTHILKDARRESGVLIEMVSDHILSEKKTVDLTDDHRLTKEERVNIYKNHSNLRQRENDRFGSMLLESFAIKSFPSNIAIGYAQVCKLFFANDSFFEKGEEFFRNPDRLLTEEIEQMRLTEPHKYFALVYCFLNDQTIDTKKLNRLKMPSEEYDTLKVYAEVCGVLHTDNVLTSLKHGLDALDRTYLTKQNTLFTISHQSIADSVSLVFGKENPEMILEKCSNRVILELLDVTDDGQNDICTLHVPAECFGQLVKRMYKMIMEGDIFDRITLESFPRFRNQKLADCLFEYITKQNDKRGFLKAHSGSIYSASNSLLESCANNVSFLRAFFKFQIDDFIVEEYDILSYTRALQRALQQALEHVRLESMSILLNKGAFLTEKCLQLAIGSNDEKLVKFVLSKNVWTESEVKKHISDNTPDHIRDTLKRRRTKCKVKLIRDQCTKQKTYINKKATELPSMCMKDMTRAAEQMDFGILHAIFQSPQLKEHIHSLIKIILESKHKMLTDAIAIKMILGNIEGRVVQHALHCCDLDMFRFVLFSTNTAQLNSMLSEAIYLNKTDHIEVLTKAGGQPSIDDFVRKAGTNLRGVESVVEVIMKTGLWTPAQLNDALDAAVTCGSSATMETLYEGGAQFTEEALVNVSKRLDDPLTKSSDTMTPEERIHWLNKLLQSLENPAVFIDFNKRVPKMLAYVFLKHKWSRRQITDAMSAALKSGSFETIQFLKEKGGKFRNDALIAAVKRAPDTQKVVQFVRRSKAWSVDQLSEALHQALVICRPDVIVYLNTMGALFNDSSLKNVLRWHLEHHIQLKFIKYILTVRTWSQELLNEAFHFACERGSLAVLAFLTTVEESELGCVLMLRGIDQLKGNVVQTLKDEGKNEDLAVLLNKEIQEGCTEIVEKLLSEMHIPCDDDSLSNAMENTRNYQRYDRLKMVRLVRESRHWSDELLMKALDKALRLGYTEVVFYLYGHGAMFSDQSLEYAITDKTEGYDIYALVTYLIKSRQYDTQQMNNALQKSLEIGCVQLLTLFCEQGAEFAEKSLRRVIHKNWKLSDRLPAVQFVLNARGWDADEKNEALLSAVKLGDIRVIRCILRCGGVVSGRCLLELLEKKCKPSHRLSIIRLLITSPGSLSQDLLIDAREKAKLLSESKLEAYIQRFIT